jgi:pimeloyl-ACP methyl ester carboxylesterase
MECQVVLIRGLWVSIGLPMLVSVYLPPVGLDIWAHLMAGESYPDAADTMALLLDKLKIDQVSLVSISGGGPPAYQLAIRHPDRIKTLVAIDSIALKTAMPADFNYLSNTLYFSSLGQIIMGYMARKYPKMVLRELIKDNSFLTKEEIAEQVNIALNDPMQLGKMMRIVRSMGNFGQRKAGVMNDIKQFTKMADTSFEKVQCPSLVVHGTHDNLLFYQAVKARDNIQKSQSLWVNKGSHFCSWIHPESASVQQQIITYLTEHS